MVTLVNYNNLLIIWHCHMNIQSTKIELVKTILNIENKELINKVARFIRKEEADFWSALSPRQQEEIKLGIQDLDSGKRVAYKTFLNKIS